MKFEPCYSSYIWIFFVHSNENLNQISKFVQAALFVLHFQIEALFKIKYLEPGAVHQTEARGLAAQACQYPCTPMGNMPPLPKD